MWFCWQDRPAQTGEVLFFVVVQQQHGPLPAPPGIHLKVFILEGRSDNLPHTAPDASWWRASSHMFNTENRLLTVWPLRFNCCQIRVFHAFSSIGLILSLTSWHHLVWLVNLISKEHLCCLNIVSIATCVNVEVHCIKSYCRFCKMFLCLLIILISFY